MFFPDLPSISETYFCPLLCHRNPKRGKMWQIDAVNRSKNVIEIESSYCRSFHRLQLPLYIFFDNNIVHSDMSKKTNLSLSFHIG